MHEYFFRIDSVVDDYYLQIFKQAESNSCIESLESSISWQMKLILRKTNSLLLHR